MPSSKLPNDVHVDSPVTYGTEAFTKSLEALMSRGGSEAGPHLIFYGGVRELREQTVTLLTQHATGNVHKLRVPSLLTQQRMQTQNNLRKAFDHAAEENALLYFETVDRLFTHTHIDTPDDVEENAAPTTVEYFFDRVTAYTGVVVLSLERERHVEWAADRVDLVVQFDA